MINVNTKSWEDILTKEIWSWKGFEFALREENRILFNMMLTECEENEEFLNTLNAKGVQFSAENVTTKRKKTNKS